MKKIIQGEDLIEFANSQDNTIIKSVMVKPQSIGFISPPTYSKEFVVGKSSSIPNTYKTKELEKIIRALGLKPRASEVGAVIFLEVTPLQLLEIAKIPIVASIKENSNKYKPS